MTHLSLLKMLRNLKSVAMSQYFLQFALLEPVLEQHILKGTKETTEVHKLHYSTLHDICNNKENTHSSFPKWATTKSTSFPVKLTVMEMAGAISPSGDGRRWWVDFTIGYLDSAIILHEQRETVTFGSSQASQVWTKQISVSRRLTVTELKASDQNKNHL